jgi:hypothetical protein
VGFALGEMERNTKKSAFTAARKLPGKMGLNPVNNCINALLVVNNL